MKVLRYVALRVGGIAIVVAMCMVTGLVIGGIRWLSAGAVGAEAGPNLVGVPFYLGIVAFIMTTPIGRAIARDVDNTVAVLILFVLLAIPYWLVVYPMMRLGGWFGWLQLADRDG